MNRGRAKRSSFKLRYPFTLADWLALLVLLSFVCVPIVFVMQIRSASRAESCNISMHFISIAKAEHAADKHLKDGTVVGPEVLWGPTGYLKFEPTCPDGGRYTLGSIGALPECSRHGGYVADPDLYEDNE